MFIVSHCFLFLVSFPWDNSLVWRLLFWLLDHLNYTCLVMWSLGEDWKRKADSTKYGVGTSRHQVLNWNSDVSSCCVSKTHEIVQMSLWGESGGKWWPEAKIHLYKPCVILKRTSVLMLLFCAVSGHH